MFFEDQQQKNITSFLRVLEGWRISLAESICQLNRKLNDAEINFVVSQIINRIIFLRIAESRGIEPYNCLKKVLVRGNFYTNLFKLFINAGKKYQLTLFDFTSDKISATISIEDQIIQMIINDLYCPNRNDFFSMPIDILGSVYEKFLGKVIRLTAGHRVKVEAKPEVRKAGGVFYTPQYIVDYIVQNTVGVLINNKTPDEISAMTIVDPACGSGSFLVGAYQFLLNYHLDFYTKEPNKKSALKRDKIFESASQTYKLTIAEKQRILQNNIFGVDIDSQAVEVTKLSLYLKLLENEGKESEGQLFSFTDLRLLPDIENNIKCGNSLIGTDFFAQQKLDLTDDELVKINCFDWEKEFANVFKKNGGFDVVIGNPPYVKEYTDRAVFENVRRSYMAKYYQGKMDFWYFFVCLGIDLLRCDGRLGFIAPNNWVTNTGASILRNKILAETKIENCIDFADFKVFKDAGIQTMIFILSKEKPPTEYVLNYSKISDKNIRADDVLKFIVTKNNNTVISDIKNINVKINVLSMKDRFINFVSENDLLILDKIKYAGNFQLIENDVGQGIVGAPDECFLIKTKKNFTRAEQFFIKDFYTSIERYTMPDKKQYILYITKNNLKNRTLKELPNIYNHFEKYKSILKKAKIKYKTPDKPYFFLHRERDENMFVKDNEKIISSGRTPYPKFHYTINEFYGSRALFFIQTGRINLKYLVGILNSKLINFWLYHNGKKQGGILQVDKIPLLEIPIVRTVDTKLHDRFVLLVDKMFQLKLKEHAEKKPQIKTVLQCQIIGLDQEIDRMVYLLYGLTEDEIKIVEGKLL
ncbi:MAG: N-6 DNA methylase [Planctomycetaceae bacterium]|jgi:adenine-specific DNA-methyltransferase|nr:N-6 DNA methylase [Planctomycetaceae bacterium]